MSAAFVSTSRSAFLAGTTPFRRSARSSCSSSSSSSNSSASSYLGGKKIRHQQQQPSSSSRRGASVVVFAEGPTEKNLEIMRKFSEQYAKTSGTSFCMDKSVTAVVIQGRLNDDAFLFFAFVRSCFSSEGG